TQYIAYIFYALSVVSIKVLLIAILLRIFAVRTMMARFMIGLLIFILAYYTAVIFVRIFLCTPISAYWIPNTGQCVDLRALFTVDSFVSLFTDAAILVLPIVLTWSLQLRMTQKIKVVAILGAGGVATLTNVYRICLLFNSWTNLDSTTLITRVEFAGNAEVTIGFICTCIPSINALFFRTRQPISDSS
ncbi:hypothetical protein N7510_009997, partial [Penicillium lagena]|uniref:uncharacterized protein n=1 Tax=Penicillium lagena TaxID=94218 RepID=UPI0025407B3E